MLACIFLLFDSKFLWTKARKGLASQLSLDHSIRHELFVMEWFELLDTNTGLEVFDTILSSYARFFCML